MSMIRLKKKYMAMSASEMLIFVLHAGLIFGDLIPEGDKHWNLYILLRNILVVVLKKSVSYELSDLLAVLVEEHHELFSNLFGKLKPKYHNLLHYPRIMKMVGPVRNFWTMRFEGKHRFFKKAANVSSNRKNLCLSLATKHQLRVNHVFSNALSMIDTVDYKMRNYETPLLLSLPNNEIILMTEWQTIAYVSVGSIKYKVGNFTVTKIQDMPTFALINAIYFKIGEDVNVYNFKILVTTYDTLSKCEHRQAYEVVDANRVELVELNNILEFEMPHVELSKTIFAYYD